MVRSFLRSRFGTGKRICNPRADDARTGLQPGSAQRAGARPSPLALILTCSAVLIAVAAELRRWSMDEGQPVAPAAISARIPGKITLTSLSASLIDMPRDVPSAHASSLAVLPGAEMLAFWWAGARESAPDVKIYASRWADGDWGPPYEIASRWSLGRALGFGIRRIGNPAAWTARDGKINLFVVATGLGGWAASRVVHLVSSDLGRSFDVRRVLPMSPLFNTSVLVRTSPVGLADGGWLLPAYFELGIKYPLVMSFENDGEPRWLSRIGERTGALQPALVPLSAFEAHAWMRDQGEDRRVQQAFTRDGGATWEDLPPLDLPNHGSSVAALRLSGGGFVLLHNHVEDDASARNILRLSVSTDARSWEHVKDIARGASHEEFSYPSVQQLGDELHVTYTSRRTGIAHHVYRIGYSRRVP